MNILNTADSSGPPTNKEEARKRAASLRVTVEFTGPEALLVLALCRLVSGSPERSARVGASKICTGLNRWADAHCLLPGDVTANQLVETDGSVHADVSTAVARMFEEAES